MTQNPTTKCCTKCGIEYPATTEFFPPYKQKLDGLHSWCRVCMRAGNKESVKKADPEKKRRMARERYHKNREKLCERQRKKRAENAEEVRRRGREYYQKNREWLVEKAREKRGSKKIDDDDDYADLTPVGEYDTFRSWAVITSAEYAAVMRPKIENEKEN